MVVIGYKKEEPPFGILNKEKDKWLKTAKVVAIVCRLKDHMGGFTSYNFSPDEIYLPIKKQGTVSFS